MGVSVSVKDTHGLPAANIAHTEAYANIDAAAATSPSNTLLQEVRTMTPNLLKLNKD